MRIACLSTDPNASYGGRDGASVQLQELVDALAGERARVLALAPGVTRDATRPPEGAVVEALPVGRPGEHGLADWLEERLARFEADALFERMALPSDDGSVAAARLGIPHLVELDAPLEAESRGVRGLKNLARLEREVLARAERVLAVSCPLATHALRRGATRVEVFPGAVAIERHPRRPRRAARPVAVFAGRVRPWHGIETVAAAWRLMGDAAPTLVVAGEAGEAAKLLEDVGAVLLGPIPHRQVPAVLAEADIGLAPYSRGAPDHFAPLKMFEYMGAGLATVAADLPATQELAPDGQAVLVPRGDAEALAAAVAELAVDDSRRERMGRAARAHVAGGHTWRHRARRLMGHVTVRVAREGPPERLLPRPGGDDPGYGPRRERATVPEDRALPQMAKVLDPEVMAEVLGRSLPAGAEPSDVRVQDLRYKPENDLVVHYDVGIGGSRHHATATIGRDDLAKRARRSESQVLADMVDGRSPAERPLSFEPSIGALVQWLPLDLSLWALAVPPAQRDRRLRAAGVHTSSRAEEPSVLGYRPHERAVVRLNGHVLEYHASHAGYGAAVAGLEVADAAPVPTPSYAGCIPELLLTVQTHVRGTEFESPAVAAGQAGAALARLHGGERGRLRDFPAGEQLRAAASAADLARRVAPELSPRLDALVDRLEARAPRDREHVTAHGDFHAGRLLDGGDGPVITGFGAMCGAPAALDVAAYAAHLVHGGTADLDTALSTLDLMIEGYGHRPEDLSWYLATTILRRSVEPFRHQDEGWPERIEEMVAAAERAFP